MCWSVKNKTRSIITASPEIIPKGGTPSQKRTDKNAGKQFDALTNVQKTAEQKLSAWKENCWVPRQQTAKQSVFLRIQVRASSQTKGLERGWKQRARPGERHFFSLASHARSRASRVRLLRHALPISLLTLRKRPTVLQSKAKTIIKYWIRKFLRV